MICQSSAAPAVCALRIGLHTKTDRYLDEYMHRPNDGYINGWIDRCRDMPSMYACNHC